MIDIMFVFVEGSTDQTFVNTILLQLLNLKFSSVQIHPYCSENPTTISKFLKSIDCMQNADYIFIGDQDGNPNKKNILAAKYKYLKKNKTFITVYEIESWIIAGLNDASLAELKIKRNFSKTEEVTKEKFTSMMPSDYIYVSFFISAIYEKYNINNATQNNHSFKELYEYIQNF